MLQILGKASSINVRKVLWTCHELGLPFDNQPWGTGHQPTDSAEFRALNPNAMVPVIRDGEFVMWESNAICRYLAAEYGGTQSVGDGSGGVAVDSVELLPRAARDRAVVEQWMDWQATELNNSWRYAFTALVRKRLTHTDTSAIAESVRNWNRHMSMLEARLQETGAFEPAP